MGTIEGDLADAVGVMLKQDALAHDAVKFSTLLCAFPTLS
jgi:hypothetical protein